MSEDYSVLLLDYVKDDVDFIKSIVNEQFPNLSLKHVIAMENITKYIDSGSRFDLYILNYSDDDDNLFDYLKLIKENYPDKKIVVLSDIHDVRKALELLNKGADYFVCKGDYFEVDFISTFNSAIAKLRIENQNKQYREIVYNPINFQTIIFKMGDMGPEPSIRDFDELNTTNPLPMDIENFLFKISVHLVTALGQGHEYSEGFYELPADLAEGYKLWIFAASMPDSSVEDPRLQKKGYIALTMFIPIHYRAILPSLANFEGEITLRLKKIGDIAKIDNMYLDKNKNFIIDRLREASYF